MRRFRNVLSCLPLVVVCLAARAQDSAHDRFELYATMNVTHASSIPRSVVLAAGAYQTQYTSLTLLGLSGGAGVALLRRHNLSVGLDVHGSTHHSTAASNALETALYGVKVAQRLPSPRLRPWIEASAGLLDAHTPNVSSPGPNAQAGSPAFASHYAVFTGTAGLDYGIARHFALRVLDVSGGTSFGAAPGISLWSFNSGIVIHF